jgi:ABC-2 type transport system permease protein
MTLLAVERIKLFSTRSPWWCMIVTFVLGVGPVALIFGLTPDSPENNSGLNAGTAEAFYGLAMMVMLVMAIIAITNEYRFGTIKSTFTAAPNRTAALLAKTAVVALVAGVVGEVTAFGAWAVANLVRPSVDISIDTAAEWRTVAGVGLIFALAAVLATAIGTLLRSTAAAVSILLVWALLLENLVLLIPRVGDDIRTWMPFVAANRFITAGTGPNGGEDVGASFHYGALGGLAYFAAIAAAFLVAALVVAERRDA